MNNSQSFATIPYTNSPIDETNIYNTDALVSRAKGSNIWIEGEDEPYIDLIMAYSSTNFGHVNDDILKVVKKAAERFDNIIAFNSSAKIELSKKLIGMLPHPGDKLVYFPVGGTKAIDAAIKLAKAYTKKDTVIAFYGAFHGYSYAAMSVTDDGYIEKGSFGTYPGKVKQFPFPSRLDNQAEELSRHILQEIEIYLKNHQDEVAAMIFEPIQGAAGFIIPPEGFLSGLIALAKKYSVISICDEIQTGVCRTGTFYYINQVDIDPDIVLLSKSLAGGYYPLSAVIADNKLYMAVDEKHSGFDSTFATNLFGIEIGNRVLDYLGEKSIPEIVKKNGKEFYNALKDLTNEYNFIKELDGIGMAYGYRVEDLSKNIEASALLAKKIKKIAFDYHLIIQTAGTRGDHMKLAPCFFITSEEMKQIFAKLKKVFDAIQSEL